MKELGGRVHLVGIGGDGMAALARLLWEGGATVSGSDVRDSARLAALRPWAEVYVGHDPEHVPDRTSAIVFSSAVGKNNLELQAAPDVPTWPRLDALGSVTRGRDFLAVVGTHGKTTTATWATWLVRKVMEEGGHYIGGEVPGLASAAWGQGRPFVAEVDESDGRFVRLRPHGVVLTSIDNDHLGTYGTMGNLVRTFKGFLRAAEKVAVCRDDPRAAQAGLGLPRPLTFGLHREADLSARGIQYRQGRSCFEVTFLGKKVGDVEVPAPGPHNVRNALAALAAGLLLEAPCRELVRALPTAPRPRRRLEVLEENGYLVVDDYAHHPTEVAAGLTALRLGWPNRRIVAVFQPHRYTRTRDLAGAFGRVLAQADRTVVTEIYPAFESPLPGVSGRWVAEAIRGAGGHALFRDDLRSALEAAGELLEPGDILVCFGAGDIWKLAREMARGLCNGS